MSTRVSFVVAVVFVGSLLSAQSSAPQDSTFQVSTDRAWTDTGMDVQAGDTLKITGNAVADAGSSGKMCDPKGVTGGSVDTASLPMPSAPAGALIARVGAHGTPTLVGASTELHAQEAGHLFLGMNNGGTPACQGGFTVDVHRGSEGTATQQTRGQQLKSQLSSAAQIFMSGQFGINKPAADSSSASAVSSGGSGTGTATASASPLKISEDPLDPQLRKGIDSLPRRVNDQFQNQGDMVNFVIVGSQKDVQAALDAANWHVADTNNERAVMNAVLQTYDSKDYLAMPMSTLFLFGRKQDFGYEMAEPIAMVASRHHFRLWKAPFTWKGSEVWVGAGTHDIGFAKDKRNNSVTHKIDPAVDGERDNIGSSLQKTNKTKTLSYYLPPDPVEDAKNATGDGYHSDGRLLVILLQ